jgi:hypothetical protein
MLKCVVGQHEAGTWKAPRSGTVREKLALVMGVYRLW